MSDLLTRKTATFSPCRTKRYTLGREWDPSLKWVCYIGHNPSDAGEDREDPTSHAFAHFARINGFGGYVTVNQYPWISSLPADCYPTRHADWGWRGDLQENLAIVAREAKRAGIVVACWGAIARDEQWTEEICEAIMDGSDLWPNIYCLGTTASGAPKHPLARGRHRIPRDQKFELWRDA